MAMKWTEEQQKVITLRDRNILVSAAAGSGKTAVLVQRILSKIMDPLKPVDIDRLLIMTFTRAAAGEMRERIERALDTALAEDPDNEHLQRQMMLIHTAQITTIDGFCSYVIRNYFHLIGLDPGYRTADEGELKLLQEDVLKELFEDYYAEGDEKFTAFVECYASGKSDEGLKEHVLDLYNASMSNPWPEEWLDGCVENYHLDPEKGIAGTPWFHYLWEIVDSALKEAEELTESAMEICGETEGPELYLDALKNDLILIRQLRELSVKQDYDEMAQYLQNIKFARLSTKKMEGVSDQLKSLVKDIREDEKDILKDLGDRYFQCTLDELTELTLASAEPLEMLAQLTKDFAGRFSEKKREKNVLDFSDMEHFALEILLKKEGDTYTPSQAARELSEKYDEVLLDEYQDSNLVQEILMQNVSGWVNERKNIFMVGDVKQSIYKFRLARPELFLEKYQSYTREDSQFQKIELHQNFRSRPQVLESTNDVFFKIMTEKLGSVAYTEDAALHPGAGYEPLPESASEEERDFSTELLLINTKDSILEELDDDSADYTRQELEARMIGMRIRELTDPEKGCLVWDKEEGAYRRAEYRDIVILLRSVSGWAESFVETLGHMGIPAFAESRTGYFTTIEVETILNFLAVLDNPMQDIPLAAVLRAPFFGLTDRELAEITAEFKNNTEKGQDRGLYGAVCAFLDTYRKENRCLEAEEAETARKLDFFTEVMEELRMQAVYLPIHELLYRIFDRTGYYDYVSAMPSGETRRANLDMLVEKAAAYESTSYRGVFHFIKYIEKLKKYNTDFGEASTAAEGGNTVRIMSIHKSKGLEFPIVFASAMGKQFNKQDTRGKILIDPQFGIGADYLDSETRLKAPTLKKNVLKRRMDLENLGEELRVLYVAMTRAKEKLILTASDKNLESKLEKWKESLFETEGGLPFTLLSLASSYLDWILMAIAQGGCRIRVRETMAKELLGQEISRQVQQKLTKDMLLGMDTSQKTLWEEALGLSDEAYRAQLEKLASCRYPWQDDLRLNTKLSVSDIKKEGEEESLEESAFLPTIPKFLSDEKDEGQGARRGTAYHRAMELLEFHKIRTKQDIREQLDRFAEEGRMTADARALVRESVIWPFFQSNLGRRMADAQREGRLKKESQFVIGIPAREIGDWDSDELVLIQGIMDAFFEENGELILVDYKTDYAEQEETLIERYKLQLDYYRRALMQMENKPVKETLIYSFRLGEIKL